MATTTLKQLNRYCDVLLRTDEIHDYDGAVNGLQVENSGRVEQIAAAVDASAATVRKAIAEGASLLLVHHGLFFCSCTMDCSGAKGSPGWERISS
jgi:putative NIF3 family GTP cyclohydrolase 1 type 2